MAAGDAFGMDIANAGDIGPGLSTVRGWRVLIYAMIRRLSTPKGFLFTQTGDEDAAEYGEDIREWLSLDLGASDLGALESRVRFQAMDEPRVKGAVVAVEFFPASERLEVSLDLDTDDGPFALVLTADRFTVSALHASAGGVPVDLG